MSDDTGAVRMEKPGEVLVKNKAHFDQMHADHLRCARVLLATAAACIHAAPPAPCPHCGAAAAAPHPRRTATARER